MRTSARTLLLVAAPLLAGSVSAQVGAPYCFGEACPCGNDDPSAGCGNAGRDGDPSTGALLEAYAGGAGFLQDELVLRVSGVAPGQPGLVFMGAGTTLAPFGDGLRCVGAGGVSTIRFPVRGADLDGEYFESALVAGSLGHPSGGITEGSTWYFQGWYRDPAGPCGSGFNLTNGLPVTFAPPTAPLRVELAGRPLASYPHFDHARTFFEGEPVHAAVDPTRYPFLAGASADLYVVATRTGPEWELDPVLFDVRGAPQAVTLDGEDVPGSTFLLDPGDLPGTQGAALAIGYDVVLDVDRDGLLGPGDLIDGGDGLAGFYVARDTAGPGPYDVVEVLHNGGGFFLQDIYYPADIASMAQVPIIVVSHGNGHQYTWYDHIGFHLASYGYVVMSHRNNTTPGSDAASLTTLSNTDYLLENQATIAGGVLDGHLDARRIVWIGHSRGGEGVVRAYDRMIDGTNVPVFFGPDDIALISSIAPTNFLGVNSANPHGAPYHLWVGSADADVSGVPSNNIAQSYQLLERAEGRRACTTVQGAGHAVFHNGGGSNVATGPCQIQPGTCHRIMQGYLLPLVRFHVEGDPAAEDFLWRPYEDFRPASAPPKSDACVVVHLEYEEGPAAELLVLEDHQAGQAPETSSSHGTVIFDVVDLTEGRLDDADSSFTWLAGDPMNGMTRGSTLDATRGVVFTWNGPSRYELGVVPALRNLSARGYLSFRACQGTRHPNTVAELGDLVFGLTLIDGVGTESTILLDAYGGGVGEPYQRTGAGTGAGWANEFETFRVRLEDFRANGSGLRLWDVHAVRFDFGGDGGSPVGRLGLDDVVVTLR